MTSPFDEDLFLKGLDQRRATLGKMHEGEPHCNGAINNGVTSAEIRAFIHVIAIYCGVPQALDCFRAAHKVLQDRDLL
ncbi:MAG: carboxymuconolactone decarboxylase family protein [Pseudomonadota bacterium]